MFVLPTLYPAAQRDQRRTVACGNSGEDRRISQDEGKGEQRHIKSEAAYGDTTPCGCGRFACGVGRGLARVPNCLPQVAPVGDHIHPPTEYGGTDENAEEHPYGSMLSGGDDTNSEGKYEIHCTPDSKLADG